MEDCMFCRIVRGEVYAHAVYENDLVLAFDDVSPQAPVHTLVIPKAHYEHLGDGMPPDRMAALFAAVPEVARIKGVSDSGYRVIVNSGADANQSVRHMHVHVLGGRAMGHRMVRSVEES